MLNTSQRLVNKNCLTWWYVFKRSWRYLDVFGRRIEDDWKTSWRRYGKMSWRRLEDVSKTSGQDEYIGLDQDVLKTSSGDLWLIRIYLFSSRRLQDVFKTSSSRRMFAGIQVGVTVNKYSQKKVLPDYFLLVKKYFPNTYYPGKNYSRWGKNAPLSWNFGCMFLAILYWECFFPRKDILPKKPFYCTLEFRMFW